MIALAPGPGDVGPHRDFMVRSLEMLDQGAYILCRELIQDDSLIIRRQSSESPFLACFPLVDLPQGFSHEGQLIVCHLASLFGLLPISRIV